MAFTPDKRLARLYAKYNAAYFDGQLPQDVVVGMANLPEGENTDTLGVTCVGEPAHPMDNRTVNIILDPKLRHAGFDHVKLVLLHEMAHLKLYPYMKHGRRFNEEMLRLAVRGAFHGIW